MTRTAALLAPVLVGAAVAVAPLAATAAPTGAATAAATASSASACPTGWGSLAKTAAPMSTAPLTGVRAGRHDCFDRLVLDVGPGAVRGWTVQYVDAVRQDGSGTVVPTRGGAAISVVAHVPAYDSSGRATYAPRDRSELAPVAGYRTFRQVVWAGSYEGYTTVGLGVRARLPFRVFALDGPGTSSRLVVDVAHTW